jgi:putative ABC transport system permease protein
VVGDEKHDGLQLAAKPEVFVPYYQLALGEMQLVVESGDGTEAVVSRVKRVLRGLDPALPIAKVSRIEDLLSASVAQPRFNMALLIGLACCAALLAAVGVYGVVNYSVARRTSEIGLRMALGAGVGETFRLVVVGALRVAMAGVVLGVIGAAVLGQAIDSLLFGVPSLDFITFAAASLALVAIGALSASLPAARAGRIDPVKALRQE